jgi:hydrogenase nickel incorporation protein HypB
MCSTCGCSNDVHVRLLDPDDQHAQAAAGGRHQAHTHGRTRQPASNGESGHEHDHDHDEHHNHEHESGVPGHEDAAAGRHEGGRTIRLEQDILAKNNLLAARNRGWFGWPGGPCAEPDELAPGAGKTTLLERTLRDLAGKIQISVIGRRPGDHARC